MEPAAEFFQHDADDLVRLALTVYLADGKLLDLIVNTSDVNVLDPDNLPDWEPESVKSGKTFKPGL